jgi:RNA polymerase sigma-70 factor (sigma-E family)
MDRDSEYVDYVSARLPALRRAAYLLCGDSHRADDIVAATAVELYRHWHRVREADNVDAYVHRCLVRRFTRERRWRLRREVVTAHVPEQAGRADTGYEEWAVLKPALDRLTRAQRTVLVLRYCCDMSVEEVARAVGCSEGNVKSHSSRGLAAMREVLADLDGATSGLYGKGTR